MANNNYSTIDSLIANSDAGNIFEHVASTSNPATPSSNYATNHASFLSSYDSSASSQGYASSSYNASFLPYSLGTIFITGKDEKQNRDDVKEQTPSAVVMPNTTVQENTFPDLGAIVKTVLLLAVIGIVVKAYVSNNDD